MFDLTLFWGFEWKKIDKKRNQSLISKNPQQEISYVKIGKEFVAAKIFENGLFHNQNELSLLTNLADTYRNLNKLKDSEELLIRALNINEKDLYALISYGRLRISQGKAKEAIDYFNKVYNILNNVW